MKFFVTKYALSAGILEVDGEINEHCATMMTYKSDVQGWNNHAHRQEWHVTKEAANHQANKMVKNKIASLERQIKKLKALKFE